MSSTVVLPDIVVNGPTGAPVALVELWNPVALSREAAIDFRELLIAHGLLDWDATFLLLLSQDKGFVWNQRSDANPRAQPLTEFSMAPVMSRYLPRHDGQRRLLGFSLDFVVITWLGEMVAGVLHHGDEPEATLAEAGFLATIRGGAINVNDDK